MEGNLCPWSSLSQLDEGLGATERRTAISHYKTFKCFDCMRWLSGSKALKAYKRNSNGSSVPPRLSIENDFNSGYIAEDS
jgi:hypothetical protein